MSHLRDKGERLEGLRKNGDPQYVPSSRLESRARFFWATFVVVVFLAVAQVVAFSYNFVAVGVVFLWLLGGVFGSWYHFRSCAKIRDEIHASRGRMCIRCGFCLRGLPDVHTCPECGLGIDISEFKKAWAEWTMNNYAEGIARELPLTHDERKMRRAEGKSGVGD